MLDSKSGQTNDFKTGIQSRQRGAVVWSVFFTTTMIPRLMVQFPSWESNKLGVEQPSLVGTPNSQVRSPNLVSLMRPWITMLYDD